MMRQSGKKEPASETTQANASTPIIGEEWCKYYFDVEKKTKAALMCNIANALKICHSKYEKLKKLNNQQNHEHESIQLGMWLVKQMHCNDTGTTNDKRFQETLKIIRMKYLEDMKSNKVQVENEISNIPSEQATQTATMDANSKNDSGDGDEESDDDDVIVLPNKNYQKSSIFDDNDDNNESDLQNAANTKTCAEVIAGTNMNDNPTTDREISKDTTAEPVKSDATKKRQSSKELKETTPKKKGDKTNKI
jgi:hypothetical protein